MINMHNELFYEPIKILKQIDNDRAEMAEQELAFLCGLIKTYKPKKLVEVGVAAGGTTAVILQCIAMLDYDTQVFSLDLSQNFYRDTSKKTGYLITDCKKILDREVEHKLFTGKFAIEYLEDIGNDIDFLILDTIHKMPGELLDFLGIYPFLKLGSIVVLHDIASNHYSNDCDAFATKILFDTVTAKKFIDLQNENNFPNIGAFMITEDTKKNINNVFSALTITWQYCLNDMELSLYRNFYEKYYLEESLILFDIAANMNCNTMNKQIMIRRNGFVSMYNHLKQLQYKSVYIYGCGKYGKQFYRWLDECGIRLKGYIISDDQYRAENDNKIYYLSEVKLDKDDIIYIGVNAGLYAEICLELEKRKIKEYIIPDHNMYMYLMK